MAKTILLIEDDAAIIEIYQIAFKAANFDIETIISGQDAMKRAKEIIAGKAKKPDLILLDIILPDINGMDILKEIRGSKETKNIPLFILSNNTDQELRKMGYDLKSERCLTKAKYTPTQLVKIVKERLKEK